MTPPTACLRDLIAGRVDMAILDPPLMQLAIQEHPDWNLKQVPLAARSPTSIRSCHRSTT